ncbi:hypothetical protein ALC53_10128, partial [Atta colombica]
STDSRSINRDVKPEPVPPPNEWKIKKPFVLKNYFRCILSWQVYREDVDPCGLTVKGILTRSLNSSMNFFRFSSVSTICIKYSETLGSIALYGDDPLDYPYLPVTYLNPIESLPMLA